MIYAAYLLKNHPNGKIGILFQNDDYGKDYVKGLKDGLGSKAASMIVAELSYETSDPTIDSQIESLKASGADVFFDVSAPEFAAQAIRKAYDIGWNPCTCSIRSPPTSRLCSGPQGSRSPSGSSLPAT